MKRVDALAVGLRCYETGKPCKAGHVGPRYTSTGHCVECQRTRRATANGRGAVPESSGNIRQDARLGGLARVELYVLPGFLDAVHELAAMLGGVVASVELPPEKP